LIWQSERLRAVSAINLGIGASGLPVLERLHREAQLRAISANVAFCAFDRSVIFTEFGPASPIDDRLRRALAYDPIDPPSIWALKVRALATAKLSDEAWSALRAVNVAQLARLPCDRDYLGTLGHLARAALLLGALDYADAIYSLLSPYPEAFSGHVAFFCEGSVSQLLGMLAQAAGRHKQAVAHLDLGMRSNERAGLGLRSAESRLQLAQALMREASAGDRARALALAREVHASAERLGMQRLVVDADTLLQRA
jgi:hypothetical protein